MSALSGAQHLASSGRTSFPVDKALHRDAYRVLGYRQCGERAVRVDILERLADLIRPALAWRETSPGEKPTGAFDGRGFVVTQAMTSLTGSAGEDFASILRALGYRMDKRPPLPPKPAPEVVVETVVRRNAAGRGQRRDDESQRQRQKRRRKKSPPICRCPAIPRRRPRCCPMSRRSTKRPPLQSRPRPSKPQRSLPQKPRPLKRLWNRRRAASAPEAAAEPAAAARPHRLKPLLPKRLPPKHLPQKPSPMRRPSLCWSKSGGPAAVPRSAARITTATASVITAARPKARRQQPAVKAPRARRASSAIAVAAATTISASPARARRPMPRLRRRRLEGAPAAKRVRTVRPASASKARAATAIAATNSIATRATATRVVVPRQGRARRP